MRILSRAILREIVSGALLGTVLFVFVLFLQQVGNSRSSLFEIVIRGAAKASEVAYLFALVLPATLGFALPIGTLVGVLIGLGRMASDGEITAMRAAGVPSRRVVAPVLAWASLMTGVAMAASLWLTPVAFQETYRVLNKIIAQELTAEIQPRVFDDQFTTSNAVLYVGEVKATSNAVAQWRNVFLASMTQSNGGSKEGNPIVEIPSITVAAEALAVPNAATNSVQLSMSGGVWTRQVDKDDPKKYNNTQAPRQQMVLMARPPAQATARGFESMATRPLILAAKTDIRARIELHQRFALPLACLLLAIVGIPLGVSSRKAGKSGAFVLTVFLAFLYYMIYFSLNRMARNGRLPVELAIWTPDVLFAIAGLVLLSGLETPGDRDILSRIKRFLDAIWQGVGGPIQRTLRKSPLANLPRVPLLPGVVDTYILTNFLFWVGMLLVSLLTLTHLFIFFELLSDVFTNHIPLSEDLRYHFFLTPMLIYRTAPISVLVAVLVTFGILAKNNEITAMKACGVSLYRLSVPVIIASSLMSVALFAFDYYIIPEANRTQDRILGQIKGRAPQTYLRPDRTWKKGEGSRIYYYRYLDPDLGVMAGVHIFELDPVTNGLVRHIAAESAEWKGNLKRWVFYNGFCADIKGVRTENYNDFSAMTFPEITENFDYFVKEVKQEAQLNFVDLSQQIRELRASGIETVRLEVQLYRKFAVPVFVLILALVSLPFAFQAGSRGAMAGVGVSLGITIVYYAVSKLFEDIGNVNQLSPALAAWAPDAIFSMAGMYLFSRVRT